MWKERTRFLPLVLEEEEILLAMVGFQTDIMQLFLFMIVRSFLLPSTCSANLLSSAFPASPYSLLLAF